MLHPESADFGTYQQDHETAVFSTQMASGTTFQLPVKTGQHGAIKIGSICQNKSLGA